MGLLPAVAAHPRPELLGGELRSVKGDVVEILIRVEVVEDHLHGALAELAALLLLGAADRVQPARDVRVGLD